MKSNKVLYIFCYTLVLFLFSHFSFGGTSVKYKLTGLQNQDSCIVTLGSNSLLKTKILYDNGDFQFIDVDPGEYFVKVEAQGYNTSPSKTVIVEEGGTVQPADGVSFAITKMSENPDKWEHSWSEDVSTSGYTTTAYVNTPPTIEFLDKEIVPSNVPSSSMLLFDYGIILSDDIEPWTQEYAYRLYETLKTIPSQPDLKTKTKFTLTSEIISNDIEIKTAGTAKEVRISTSTFTYANPFIVKLDGVRGSFYSKRLHHALVNFLTDFGENENSIEYILRERFGCSVIISDYDELTANTTQEDAGRFQKFFPSELVAIINMFEEMPSGFHKIPELKYLVRRMNGHDHPLYPNAAAVAWTTSGYIEFMEHAFGDSNQRTETLRLILHEKTHFLWEHVFSDEIKNDWIELGGWYEDPNSGSGWSTTKQTEFVSAYAHAFNPDEDMAESVAYYLKSPEALQSRSLPKYEFIRDRIMHGTRYISKIPDHLTFEVLNLFPDYDYPGKIKRLNIAVEGKPDEEKYVTVEIELNHMEGFDDGASLAFTRIHSPKFEDSEGELRSQFIDMYLYPVNGNPHLLRGSGTINKYGKAGYWTTGQIIVRDIHMNQRFEGQNDYVWSMYVNNPLEDVEPPKYVENSLEYALKDTVVEGNPGQNLQITFGLTDNIGFRGNGDAVLRLYVGENTYSWRDQYGDYDKETGLVTVNCYIPHFFRSSYYYVHHMAFVDLAGNTSGVNFSDSPLDQPVKKIYISTSNPDTIPPEVDLNRITVYAEPTNKENPDGETLVTINYFARDNNSGLGKVSFKLLDPQGLTHFDYHYHDNFYSTYFEGDATVWKKYTINTVLPQGSAPGIWGLSELFVQDKALNGWTYNFVETLIFEPENSSTDFVLSAIATDTSNAVIEVTSEIYTNNDFEYRLINELSGAEINGKGKINEENHIDISGLGYGQILVIANIKDTYDETIAIRSGHFENNQVISDINGPEISDNNHFSVYPNPATDKFKIVAELPVEGAISYYLYNSTGDLIEFRKRNHSEMLPVEDFDVSKLATGIYFIRISTSVKSISKKFVVGHGLR